MEDDNKVALLRDKYHPSEEEAETIRDVNEKTSEKILYGIKYEVNRRALLDLAYYNGHQYSYWDENAGRLKSIPVNENRSRIIVNKVMPRVQMACNLLSQNLSFEIRPKTNDFRSKAEALNGERAIRHLYNTKRWRRKLRTAMRWCVTTGVGFVRTIYDPNAGPKHEIFVDPQDNLPIPDEYLDDNVKAKLRAAGLSKIVPMGDIDLEVYSVFDVAFPDGATDLFDCPWYSLVQRRSLSYLKGRYKNGKYVQPESVDTAEAALFESRILAMAGGTQTRRLGRSTYFSAAVDDTESALIRVLHESPCPEYPNGRVVTVANGVLLEEADSPTASFGLNGFDLHKFDFIARPGSIWPVSLVENLIPVQRELNSTRSHRADLRRQGLQLRTFLPRGANMAKSHTTSGDFHTVVEVDQDKVGQVTHAPFPNIPQALFQEVADSERDMWDLTAQHEASQGQNPSGVRSGYAINLLNEKDLNFYREIIEGHAETFEILWGNIHQMVKRTWTMPRYVSQLQHGELVYAGFIGATDLAENAAVVVDVENLVPQSKAAKQAFASELVQYAPNLIQLPPLLRSAILDAMDLGDTQSIKDIWQLDTRWAERAIQVMIGDPQNGQPGFDMPVRPGIDDHEVQLQVVRNFQKTAAYDMLPPDAKIRIERYARGHNTALVEGLMAQGAFLNGPQAPPKQPAQSKSQQPAEQQA